MAKDHYIPQFYLGRWIKKGKTSLYSAYLGNGFRCIDWQRKAKKSVGYQKKLYQEQEELFFKPLDDKVSKILHNLDGCNFALNESISLTVKERDYWSVYISAQLLRTPSVINEFYKYFQEYPKFRKIMNKWDFDSDKECELIREQITKVIVSDKIIKDLNKMQWMFCKVRSNKEIITSDNPLIFEPRQLNSKECIMLLPLSPDSFALGVNNLQNDIFELSNNEIVKFINIKMIQNANERIFARSKYSIEDCFLKKKLNKRVV